MRESEEEYLARLAEHEATKSLCRSLVMRALRDYVTYRKSKRPGERRLFSEAHEWIFNGFTVDEIEQNITACVDPIVVEDCTQEQARKALKAFDVLMSFETVCAILGWDAGLMRKRAKVLTQADLDRIGPNLMDL